MTKSPAGGVDSAAATTATEPAKTQYHKGQSFMIDRLRLPCLVNIRFSSMWWAHVHVLFFQWPGGPPD